MSLAKREFEVQQEREAPAARVERARRALRSIRRDVEIYEGRLLDCGTAAEMQRTLSAAEREMEALQLTLAVIERQERMISR